MVSLLARVRNRLVHGALKIFNRWGIPSVLSNAGYTRWFSITDDGFSLTGLPHGLTPEERIQIYRTCAPVRVAIDTLARLVVQVPFGVFKTVEGEDTMGIPNHPFEQLLIRPNPLQSRADLFHNVVVDYLLHGYGCWYLRFSPSSNRVNSSLGARKSRKQSQVIQEIWQLPVVDLEPIAVEGEIRAFRYRGRIPELEIPMDNLVFFRAYDPGRPVFDYQGASVVDTVARPVFIWSNITEWLEKFFKDGTAKPAGILEFREMFTPNDWETIRKYMEQNFGGTNRGLFMYQSSGEGVRWIPMSHRPIDTDYIAGIRYFRDDIVSTINPGLAAVLSTDTTHATAYTGKTTVFTDTLGPLLNLLSGAINTRVMPWYDTNEYRVLFKFKSTQLLDQATEFQNFVRVHTINEVRARYYDSPPLDRPEVGEFVSGVPATLQSPSENLSLVEAGEPSTSETSSNGQIESNGTQKEPLSEQEDIVRFPRIGKPENRERYQLYDA